MRDTLFATFADTHHMEQAVGALLDHGVQEMDISILLNDAHPNYVREGNDIKTASDVREKAEHGITTTTPQDAAAGAAAGAGVGLGIGALAALAAVTLPGIGLVLGGGALAIALAGLAGTTAAGAVAGGSLGYLKDMGVPGESIDKYSHVIRGGGALVSVSVPSGDVSEQAIRDILAKYSSEGIELHPVTSRTMDPAVTPLA